MSTDLSTLTAADVALDVAYLGGGMTSADLGYEIEADGDDLVITVTADDSTLDNRVFRFTAVTS